MNLTSIFLFHLHPVIHPFNFYGVLAILQIDESMNNKIINIKFKKQIKLDNKKSLPGVVVFFVAIKNKFRQLVFVANTTQRRTGFTTETNAEMAARETFPTGFITRWPDAKFKTLQ